MRKVTKEHIIELLKGITITPQAKKTIKKH